MEIRISTIGVPLFKHAGLVVTGSWSALEIEGLEPRARAALLQFTGRLIKIHPHDVAKLPGIGLELRGKQLVEVAPVELGAAAAAPVPRPASEPDDPDELEDEPPAAPAIEIDDAPDPAPVTSEQPTPASSPASRRGGRHQR